MSKKCKCYKCEKKRREKKRCNKNGYDSDYEREVERHNRRRQDYYKEDEYERRSYRAECEKRRRRRKYDDYSSDSDSEDYRRRRPKKDCYDECSTDCDTDVEVEVDVMPEVKCKEVFSKGTKFEVELDFKATPNCHISEKKVCRDHKGAPCESRCAFVVDVDVDFKCKPKISKCPGTPRAKYDLDVHVDTEAQCKVKRDRRD